MRRLSLFISAILLCGIVSACTNLASMIGLTNPSSSTTANPVGRLSCAVSLTEPQQGTQSVRDDIDRIELTLTGGTIASPRTTTLSKAQLNQGTATASFDAVPTGAAVITGVVKDASGKQLGTGTTTVTIISDQLATANLVLTVSPPAVNESQSLQINGRATFQGGDLGVSVPLGLKKFDGTRYQRTTTTNTLVTGIYSFGALVDGTYQVFYEDPGAEVTDPAVNTVGTYTSESVTIASGSANTATASVNFDLAWPFTPTIRPYDTFVVPSTFRFMGIPALPGAEYQILVADNLKKAVWSSAFGTSKAITWNGKSGAETNAPTTAYSGVGRHYYLIKFRKPGTTWGDEGYYGQTMWVPFYIAR